ncbi:MAG: DUF434 domain-containing protein [Planctomycetota bacterium]
MPDRRTHRGQHPQDSKLFGVKALESLRSAVADMSLLLSKGYAQTSTLKLVGDKFGLTQRQRLAVMRSACSDEQVSGRENKRVEVAQIVGQPLVIDGYNLLISVEAAMSGGFVFIGRDGCFRDLAGIHGTYRKVSETVPAIELIGRLLEGVGVSNVLWLLDRPVSNSGRLKTLINELAGENEWAWTVELVVSPDAVLAKSEHIIATSDSAVLDKCCRWVNLARCIIESELPKANLVEMSS